MEETAVKWLPASDICHGKKERREIENAYDENGWQYAVEQFGGVPPYAETQKYVVIVPQEAERFGRA